MLRGKKWYNFRNRDNVLHDDIKLDEGKMCDVEYFLENSKPKKKMEAKK